MKRIFGLLIALVMVLGFSIQAHATLILKGTDTLGNRLIYDDDFDITWYDYTNASNTWQNHMDWADALSVDFGGTIYDDWRLPTALNQDGTECFGWNCTGSEMGHLFYTELGNKGYYATDGTNPQPGWGLTSTGDFLNLIADAYWSGTEYASYPIYAWGFNFHLGGQRNGYKGDRHYALAVRPGDSAPIPEPSTMLLLGSGLAGLGAFRKKFRKK